MQISLLNGIFHIPQYNITVREVYDYPITESFISKLFKHSSKPLAHTITNEWEANHKINVTAYIDIKSIPNNFTSIHVEVHSKALRIFYYEAYYVNINQE